VLGVQVPTYAGTKHSTATDAIRRGLSLEQIHAALRHADPAATRVYAKLARSGSFDILRKLAGSS
jgi:site-specific recombinase XerD